MLMGIIMAIHILACVGLIFFILIQQGKGGGLIDNLSSAESILGTKTNAFLAKATTGFAITFFITCLLLAFFSMQQSQSIVTQRATKEQKTLPAKQEAQTIPQESQALAKKAVQGDLENTQTQAENKETNTEQKTDAAKETAATTNQ